MYPSSPSDSLYPWKLQLLHAIATNHIIAKCNASTHDFRICFPLWKSIGRKNFWFDQIKQQTILPLHLT